VNLDVYKSASNIRTDLQEVGCGYMDWNGLAQDRDRWRTLVSAIMNLRVPWNAGNFSTSCKPVSFSRRTLHHGVSKYTCFKIYIWNKHTYTHHGYLMCFNVLSLAGVHLMCRTQVQQPPEDGITYNKYGDESMWHVVSYCHLSATLQNISITLFIYIFPSTQLFNEGMS